MLREPVWAPRYNIAPRQPVLAVRSSPAGREPCLLLWGLVPSWADDPKIGARLINARKEMLAAKPAFRGAFRRHRCLIPADGFYEWRKSSHSQPQPYFFHYADDRPFAFAGLWDHWTGSDGSEIESCTIVTTEANKVVRPIHHRMPVILKPENYERWLDPDFDNPKELEKLLESDESNKLVVHPASPLVNSFQHDSPDCLQPPPSSSPSSQKTFDF